MTAMVHGELYARTARGWQHVPCGTHVGFTDGAITDHTCPTRCPECGEPDAVTVNDGDGPHIWACCGAEVACPGCDSTDSLRYSAEIGAYCTRCPFEAAS